MEPWKISASDKNDHDLVNCPRHAKDRWIRLSIGSLWVVAYCYDRYSNIADEVAVGLHGILKRDSRGRVLTTQEQRGALLQAFENSGLSGRQFARVAGINYQTFATWRQQHKRQACETKDSGNLDTGMVGFVEAVIQGRQDAASALSPSGSVALRFCPAMEMHLEFELELSHRDQLPLVVAT